MPRASFNPRTVAYLKRRGWLTATVETRLNGYITRDLFGLFDVLAVRDDITLAVQATGTSNMSSHVHKLEAAQHALRTLFEAGWVLELWGWAKKPGSRLYGPPTVRRATPYTARVLFEPVPDTVGVYDRA